MINGIIFAGCSFTWGEGLELYSNYPSVNYDYYKEHEYHWPHVNDCGFVKASHIEYIKSNRWSRIVSSHYNTFDCVDEENGGSIPRMKLHIEKCLKKYGEDISHLVIQFTEHARDLELKGLPDPTKDDEHYGLRRVLDSRIEFDRGDISESIYKSKAEYNIWKETFGDKNAIQVDDELFEKNVIEFLKWLRDIQLKHSLKLYFIGTWTNDSERYDMIEKWDKNIADFYNKNLIRIHYNGESYRSIYELTKENSDGKFSILDDLPYTNNDHPSKKLHDLLGETVINKLKKDYEN
jgi:hypothetical protein